MSERTGDHSDTGAFFAYGPGVEVGELAQQVSVESLLRNRGDSKPHRSRAVGKRSSVISATLVIVPILGQSPLFLGLARRNSSLLNERVGERC